MLWTFPFVLTKNNAQNISSTSLPTAIRLASLNIFQLINPSVEGNVSWEAKLILFLVWVMVQHILYQF